MEIRWTLEAVNDLSGISDHIWVDSPDSARRVVSEIHERVSALLIFPNRGRFGTAHNSRELVITRYPYVVTYEIREEIILVLRIYHAARNRTAI